MLWEITQKKPLGKHPPHLYELRIMIVPSILKRHYKRLSAGPNAHFGKAQICVFFNA